MNISSTILCLFLLQETANAFVHPRAFSTRPLLALDSFTYSGEAAGGVNFAEENSFANPYTQGPGGSLSTSNTREQEKSKPKARSDPSVIVQGGSLRTWSLDSVDINRVHVLLKTGGRPLNAYVDLWHGPDNTPQKISVFLEDGSQRPFNAIIETPRGQNTVAIRNTATLEYPLLANVEATTEISASSAQELIDSGARGKTIQGYSIKTYSFGAPVGSVQVLLKSDGRPISARIELLQGPNTSKQVVDVYSEDGSERPFYALFETPGTGNVLRIVNTATMEYPMTAYVEPFAVEPGYEDYSSGGSWSQTNDASFFFVPGDK